MRQTWEAAFGSNISCYSYDARGNRVLSQQGIADQADIVSHTVETAYQGGSHRWITEGPLAAHYDPSGQPRRIGQREYVWDALGKLIEVREENHSLARYRYNHRGERIIKRIGQQGKQAVQYLYEDSKLVAEIDARGRIVRQYVYLGEQPIATIDTPEGKVVAPQGASLPVQIARDIGTAFEAWFGNSEQAHWLHANHLGAIEAVTDAQGTLAWQMRYGAFGQIMQAAAAGTQANTVRFELNLRLPGQYEDSETGLYYNGQRYYDPQRGRYLTPDPLGTPDGPNPYAYVRNNPLRYIDPSGLVLFAFDGTGNTKDEGWLAAQDSSLSNVWKFWQLYADGNASYVTGVGTVHHDDQYGDIDPKDFKPFYIPLTAEKADMGANYSGPARIERMVLYFNDEADLIEDDSSVMDVDIVGFSRGSAEARDFANRIIANTNNGWYSYKSASGQQACQKLNFRFMGLFDTVLSTNWSGTSYNLAIPDQFAYVAQAVALNEHRLYTGRKLPDSPGAFPLESIMGNPIPAGVTHIERGFIGAHADIGGGFGKDESQLSQVALVWMVEQAKSAGVKIDDPTELHNVIANPVVHDKSNNQYATTGHPVAPGREDREVLYRDGKTTWQMAMTGAGMTWADTQNYISYLPADGPFIDGEVTRVPRADFVTGTVDMQGYLDWLNENGYDINLTVH